MPGAPRKRAMRAELAKRASAADMTVLEYAVDWVENGKTLTDLASALCEAAGQANDYITRSMVSRYLNKELEGSKELGEARLEGAHGMAEGAIVTVRQDAEDKVEAAQIKTRAEMQLKLAGYWNKPEYGEQKGAVNVQLNMGQMHLDALRRQAVPVSSMPSLPPAEPCPTGCICSACAPPPSAEGADYTFEGHG